MARLYDEGGRAPGRAFVYDVRFDDEQTTCKDRQEDFAEHRNGFRHRMVYVAGEQIRELVLEFPPTTRYGMRNINGERVCAMMDEKTVHAALKRIIGDNYTRVLYKAATGKRSVDGTRPKPRCTAGSKTGADNLTRALIWFSIISTTTA